MEALCDRLAPDRFVQYFHLDYAGWDAPDLAERAVKQVERARELGAAGCKEYKRLGLYLRDGQGELVKMDDPKLDGVWRRGGRGRHRPRDPPGMSRVEPARSESCRRPWHA